jgi:hypothetical protein
MSMRSPTTRPIAISGGNDCTIRVWDLDAGQPLGGPLVHDRFVNAVAVGELQARSLVAPVVLRRRCGQTWRRRFPTRAGKLR